jgi:hypothetical protein
MAWVKEIKHRLNRFCNDQLNRSVFWKVAFAAIPTLIALATGHR